MRLTNFLPVAEGIERLMHPFAEVVLHDLLSSKIIAIYNSFSCREVGDESFLEDFEIGEDDVIGPYEKINYDGRCLKSISIVLRNGSKPYALMCINMDVSVFEKYQGILQNFLNNYSNKPADVKEIFKDDLYEQINIFVQSYCREKHLSLDVMGREEKRQLIVQLKAEGALRGKNATSYIAKIFGISRATVYNYLK